MTSTSASVHFETLLFDVDKDGLAICTINRPDKLNALNATVLDELQQVVEIIEKQDEIRGMILTGAGEKAFVAGADIKELSRINNKLKGKELSVKGQNIFNRFESCPKPVIAVVNGYALGGGAELAMACHIRIASEQAVFGLPEVSLGLIPGYGGTQRLPQLIGKSKAMELILTGGMLKAGEAKAWGLVSEVVSPEKSINYAKELIFKILKNGPKAISNAISAINASSQKEGFAMEAELFGELCETEDFKEGTAAFLEKRKPEFKGR